MPRWDIRFDLFVNLNDPELQRSLAQAEEIAKLISLLPIPPAVTSRVNRLNILRAVRGTTGLEGANLTEEEVGQILDHPGRSLGPSREREEQETRNAAQVMRFVSDTLLAEPDQPLSEELIRRIHAMTVSGIAYPNNRPGRYRQHNVVTGDYSAPPYEVVPSLMEQFVHWFHAGPAGRWPALVQAVAAHFFFISIHPFGDGNGRTARAIESFVLFQGHVNVVGFYSLSNFYYRNRSRYIEMLDEVRFRSEGSLMPLLLFAVRGLVEELESVRDGVLAELRYIVFREVGREVLERERRAGKPAGERMIALLDSLRGRTVSIRDIRRPSHPLGAMWRTLSSKTFERDLSFLQANGLVVRDGDSLSLNLDITRQPTP